MVSRIVTSGAARTSWSISGRTRVVSTASLGVQLPTYEHFAVSFNRRSQIFLRYRLGDVARWDPEATHVTGTPVLAEISGRIEDVVIAPDGRRTVRFHGIFTELPGVREAQVIQEERDRLRIRVVPSPSFGPDTVAEIVRRIHQRLTAAMRVDVEAVDAIARTAAGKFQAVISKLQP